MKRCQLPAQCLPVVATSCRWCNEFHENELVVVTHVRTNDGRNPDSMCVEQQRESFCFGIAHSREASCVIPFQKVTTVAGLKAPSVVDASTSCGSEAKRTRCNTLALQGFVNATDHRFRNGTHCCRGEKFRLPFTPAKIVRGGAGL